MLTRQEIGKAVHFALQNHTDVAFTSRYLDALTTLSWKCLQDKWLITLPSCRQMAQGQGEGLQVNADTAACTEDQC